MRARVKGLKQENKNCEYFYENENSEKGYRFIWKKPNENLQPARF